MKRERESDLHQPIRIESSTNHVVMESLLSDYNDGANMAYWACNEDLLNLTRRNVRLPVPCAVPMLQDVWISAAFDSDHCPVDSCWHPGVIYPTVTTTSEEPFDSELEDELLSLQDPARISPKVSLRLDRCRMDIREEISDLFKIGPSGVPSLIAVSLSDVEYKNAPTAHATMIAKKKIPSCLKPGFASWGISYGIYENFRRAPQPLHASLQSG